jgi:hypothetical protein
VISGLCPWDCAAAPRSLTRSSPSRYACWLRCHPASIIRSRGQSAQAVAAVCTLRGNCAFATMVTLGVYSMRACADCEIG